MANRFRTKRFQTISSHKQGLSLLLCVILLILFFYGIHTIGNSTSEQQAGNLIATVHKNIVHCYALEGTYPPSLEYLTSHYGFVYDEKQFFIDYVPIGSNIYPDVTIILKEGQ